MWSDNQILTAAALNGEFNNILTDYNGGITNANISASAAIAYSKLSLSGGILNADISTSAAIATTKINTTFPTGTIVGTSDTQTLTNKTITGPITNIGITTMSAQAVDGTQQSSLFTRVLAASETFTQSGFSTGRVFMIKVQQGSGTSYTVTWFSGITWIISGGTVPTQTTTSSGYTTYGFVCTGTNTFDGYLVGTQ